MILYCSIVYHAPLAGWVMKELSGVTGGSGYSEDLLGNYHGVCRFQDPSPLMKQQIRL